MACATSIDMPKTQKAVVLKILFVRALLKKTIHVKQQRFFSRSTGRIVFRVEKGATLVASALIK